ncbi:MAG: zf-HC2 domain-containing protein [Chloroflexi bacterium]|nr:zf-HC2 domain-containing protein [Chloroflexota bacterium]
MNCSEAKRQLHFLVDGALAAEDKAAVLEHTRQCPACAQELHELEHVFELLDGLSPLRARPGFIGRVATRLDYQKPITRSGWARLIGNASLAMAGVLGLCLILVTIGDLLTDLSSSEASADIVQSVGDLPPLLATDGLLFDPLAWIGTLHESSLAATSAISGEFLLGATLVLVACFLGLYQLLTVRHSHHQRLDSQSLRQ